MVGVGSDSVRRLLLCFAEERVADSPLLDSFGQSDSWITSKEWDSVGDWIFQLQRELLV